VFPIALTIAGSDSSGGAGIQADLKTFSALNVYGASVITALTAQNTQGVSAVHEAPPNFVRAQMDAVLDDLDVKAIKIGMLSSSDIIYAVSEGLTQWGHIPIVLDPVMVAASGARLLNPDAIKALVACLFPIVHVITPNLLEAAALLDEDIALDEHTMKAQGRELLKRGAKAILMKGGHGTGETSVDWLMTHDSEHRFCAPRIATFNTHGTGCTLASAIAAHFALGQSLIDAVKCAKDYITQAIAHADQLNIGQGHGPVHHFYRSW
jgi:hydroxymethylpyrimidine/phosphomethylpyrimidine kinase